MALKRMIGPAKDLRVAVFDVDETLIRRKSMFDFLEFVMCQALGLEAGSACTEVHVARLRKLAKSKPRTFVNREFYRIFRGWSTSEIERLAKAWFSSVDHPEFYFEDVLKRYRQHKSHGDFIVLLSGSARLFLRPLANLLEPDHVLAIDLEQDEFGILTGEISGIQTIGDGKRIALASILAGLPEWPELFGYGDHPSDFPFLDLCDHAAVVVNQSSAVSSIWPTEFELISVH